MIAGGDGAATRYLTSGAKAAFAAACLAIAVISTKRGIFFELPDRTAALYNSLPVFLILMVMTSPLVWEHHPVLLCLPYLLVLKRLTTEHEWLLFGFAYFLEFLVPTFDLFPWSYGRLLSPIVWLWLVWSVRTNGLSPLFVWATTTRSA